MKNEIVTEIVTSDLSKFGYREIEMASELLKNYNDCIKILEFSDFADTSITLQMNTNSGYVFLVNDDFQVLMMKERTIQNLHISKKYRKV